MQMEKHTVGISQHQVQPDGVFQGPSDLDMKMIFPLDPESQLLKFMLKIIAGELGMGYDDLFGGILVQCRYLRTSFHFLRRISK